MKKYRLTRITVKTREVISLSKGTADVRGERTQAPVCPLCHSPLVLPHNAESSAVAETAEHDCPKPENE